MNDDRADEQDDHPSMRWSRTFFVLTLIVWAFVLLESVSAAQLAPSEKQWYQDPQKVTVVLIGIYPAFPASTPFLVLAACVAGAHCPPQTIAHRGRSARSLTLTWYA